MFDLVCRRQQQSCIPTLVSCQVNFNLTGVGIALGSELSTLSVSQRSQLCPGNRGTVIEMRR